MDPSFLFLFALVAALALFPGWRVNDRVVARWARSAGLELSAEGQRVAARYLRWTKCSRTAGGLVGLAVPYLIWGLTDTPGQYPPLPLGWVLLGYVIGGLGAEVLLHRQRLPVAAALLVPRRLPDYLSGRLLGLQRGLAVVSLPLVALLAWEPWPDVPARSGIDGGLGGLILLGLSAPVVAIVAEGLQRTIVGRRQQVVDDEAARLDDAFRSHSVQALAGAALAMLCFIVGVEVLAVGSALGDRSPVSELASIAVGAIGVVLLLATLAFWVGLAEPRRLRIRRLTGVGATV